MPGGHDDGFDLVEIEPATDEEKIEHTRKTVERAWQLWNDGRRVYFAAGSDVHDVWNKISGSARSYVHVQGELTIEKFIDSLKNGRSYASQGPLIFPELMFGSEIQHAKGAELRLKYSVYAVNGLKSVQLIGQGEEVDRSDMQMNATSSSVEFTVYPGPENSWYSLVVVDSNDKRAYSNPIWVSIAD